MADLVEIVDTHCHIQGSTHGLGVGGEVITQALWAKAGFPSGNEIITRAADYGVTKLICVGCSLPDSILAVDFVQNRPQCHAAIGVHPHEAKEYQDGVKLDAGKLAQFADLATDPKVVAIGECGLDYFYDHSKPTDQVAILEWQIELAQKYDLPMVFHVRKAFDDFWPIFNDYHARQPIRGVLHSFTDSAVNLSLALEKGLYVGVNGIATFSKNPAQLEMYKSIPLSRLLLETDSPFLTPSPYRGSICEPYHTSVTAEFLATLRNEPLSELAMVTTANAHKLFKF